MAPTTATSAIVPTSTMSTRPVRKRKPTTHFDEQTEAPQVEASEDDDDAAAAAVILQQFSADAIPQAEAAADLVPARYRVVKINFNLGSLLGSTNPKDELDQLPPSLPQASTSKSVESESSAASKQAHTDEESDRGRKRRRVQASAKSESNASKAATQADIEEEPTAEALEEALEDLRDRIGQTKYAEYGFCEKVPFATFAEAANYKCPCHGPQSTQSVNQQKAVAEKAGSQTAASQTVAQKKTAPKKTAPKKTAPKKAAPKKTPPKQTAPKKASKWPMESQQTSLARFLGLSEEEIRGTMRKQNNDYIGVDNIYRSGRWVV